MKTIFYPASQRGGADHGWLQSYHSFSFAQFYHPEKIHFGMLRVLNDDIVAPGRGFGMHPHDNMEIITIPLFGTLAHRDSTGGSGEIQTGEVQIMHAGTGIYHSEMNASSSEPVGLFQIWIFPEKKNIAPSYEQRKFAWQANMNKWTRVVAPNDEGALWINQKAWLNLTRLEAGTALSYLKNAEGSGFYLMAINGEIKVGDQILTDKDALGIWETDSIEIQATKEAQVLLIEVPMN